MPNDKIVTAIASWLMHLHALYPPHEVVVVNPTFGNWPDLLESLAIERAYFVEADDRKLKKIYSFTSRHKHWQVVEQLLGEVAQTTKYYRASNPSENGMASPEQLQAIWPNLKTLSVEEKLVGTLDSLLACRESRQSHNWLIVDCLPALAVLLGAVDCLRGCDVVVARAVQTDVGEIPDLLCKPKLDAWMEEHGYRCIAYEEERHPAIVKVVYVRDTSGFEQLQTDREKLMLELEHLSEEKKLFEKVAVERQKQFDELKKASEPQPNPYGHNRILNAELNGKLREFGKSVLGIEGLKPAYIDYVACRSLHQEKNCVGRLATTVQDVVARQLVAQCLKDSELNILEIGALYGINLAILYNHTATRFDKVHITCLDPFDGYYGQAFDPHLGIPVDDTTFIRNMAVAHVPESNFRVIKKYSTDPEAVEMAQGLNINLLIIDGDHSYSGVKFDFETYFPLLAPGGYIIFDDYHVNGWPGVQKFVDEEIRNNLDCDFLGFISRTAVARKRLL